MPIDVSGTAVFECQKCGKKHHIDAPSEAEWEIVESHKRQMGAEAHHAYRNEFTCDACGNEIKVEVSAWEYPEGVFDHSDYSSTSGAETKQEWVIHFHSD